MFGQKPGMCPICGKRVYPSNDATIVEAEVMGFKRSPFTQPRHFKRTSTCPGSPEAGYLEGYHDPRLEPYDYVQQALYRRAYKKIRA